MPHLGLVDLDASRPLANLVERLLGGTAAAAQIVEPLGDAAHLVALLAADLHQLVVPRLDHVAVTVDQRGERFDGAQRLLDLAPSLPGLRSCLDIGLETPLGLLKATLEELLALVQTRRCAPRGPGGDRPAGRPARRAGARASPRDLAASASAASPASSSGTSASSSAMRWRSRPNRSVASPSVCSNVSSSACASRRSPCVRASASELAENPAS